MKMSTMQTSIKLFVAMLLMGVTSPVAAKDLIEYFKPTPIVGTLSSSAWGTAATGPRDQKNGLEDATLAQYVYWDGQILKGSDGKYHMYASRWAQSAGHAGWGKSVAITAISDALLGPYVDKGMAYTDSSGKGHNVTGALLPDGKYTLIVSDTRPGVIFLSSVIDGPFNLSGTITVDANGFDSSGTAKNLSLVILPDKTYLMATRFGAIMTTPTDLLGPWKVQGPRVFTTPTGYPNGSREDPVIWCSGGQYHLVYNYYDVRKARHMVSPDGIKNWKDIGIAYDPTANFIRYTDGTVNHWYKLERPGVYLENGHVAAFTFAGIDVTKTEDLGGDKHGSKIIVVPFDGETFDAETGVAGNACSSYSAWSGVPGTTTSTGGAGGTTASDAGAAGGATGKDSGSGGGGGNTAGGGAVASGGATANGGAVAGGGAMANGGATSKDAGANGGTPAAGGATTSTPGSGGTTVASAGGMVTVAAGGTTSGGTSNGTGGAAISSGGSTSSTGGKSGSTTTNSSSSSGCSFTGTNRASATSFLTILGALGLMLGLRRRRR